MNRKVPAGTVLAQRGTYLVLMERKVLVSLLKWRAKEMCKYFIFINNRIFMTCHMVPKYSVSLIWFHIQIWLSADYRTVEPTGNILEYSVLQIVGPENRPGGQVMSKCWSYCGITQVRLIKLLGTWVRDIKGLIWTFSVMTEIGEEYNLLKLSWTLAHQRWE